MPLYRGTTFKRSITYGLKWSNVYTLLCATVTDALTTIQALRELERACSYDTVEFYAESVVNVADRLDRRHHGTAVYTGALATTGLGGPLPLFLTNRIVYFDNVGKPEMKYMRFGAQRNNLSLGQWDGEWITFVTDTFADPLFGTLEFVGPAGNRPTGFEVEQLVQNRQLGWHRRTRPGFRRGWVPV
jgi:hypothetical protein